MNKNLQFASRRFRFAGYEEAYHDVTATDILPKLLADRKYQRVYIVSSKTLNTKTDVVRNVEKCLGDKWIGTTHEVGEHSPLNNVLAGAKQIKAANADVILGIGGGSVLDFVKFVQLCITEDIYDKKSLLAIEAKILPDFGFVNSTNKVPAIRTIVIPTTMSTAEWTSGGTPVIEETKLKAIFIFKWGAPEVIIYDPEIVSKTPVHLLIATAIRGLDHSINSACSVAPHPLAKSMAENAVQLYIENLPALQKNPNNREAMNNCQLATSLCGMGQMSAVHGFSHFMGHIIGPYAGVGHSEVACILMLAQAKWLEKAATKQHGRLKQLLGRPDEPFHQILEELLLELRMPTRFKDIGVTSEQLDEMAPLAMDHPLLTKFNLIPLETPEEVRTVLALGE